MEASDIEPSDFTISREADGETLVLDARTNLVHQLNRTASFIWRRARSGSAPEEIAATLAEEYDIDAETARRDVSTTLAQLCKLNLLTGH